MAKWPQIGRYCFVFCPAHHDHAIELHILAQEQISNLETAMSTFYELDKILDTEMLLVPVNWIHVCTLDCVVSLSF